MPSRKCSLAEFSGMRGDPSGVTRRNNCGDVPSGNPRGIPYVAPAVGRGRRMLRVGAAAGALSMLGVAVVGCGGGDASGATVSVYVAAPFCKAAKADLASHGAGAGHFTVAVRCLAPSESGGGRVDLATDGANSRRATSDTSAVATLEPPGPGTRFSRPILESAGIPLVTSPDAKQGMSRVIKAIEGAGDSNVRESVQGALEPS
jgi:hypothetical protein